MSIKNSAVERRHLQRDELVQALGLRRKSHREPVQGRDDQVRLFQLGPSLLDRQQMHGLGQVDQAKRLRHWRWHVAAQKHPLALLVFADRTVFAAVDHGEAALLAQLVAKHGSPAHVVMATAITRVPAAHAVLADGEDLAVLQAVLGVLVVDVIAQHDIPPVASASDLAFVGHSETSYTRGMALPKSLPWLSPKSPVFSSAAVASP